jgi:hypothetical protein
MSYKLNLLPNQEQLKMLLLKKLELEENIAKIDAVLTLAAPENVQLAYGKLAEEGKIVAKTVEQQ